jgi:hypothetical protein
MTNLDKKHFLVVCKHMTTSIVYCLTIWRASFDYRTTWQILRDILSILSSSLQHKGINFIILIFIFVSQLFVKMW